MSEHTINIVLGLGMRYEANELLELTRKAGYHVAMPERMRTRTHWHFAGATGEDGHVNFGVFVECETGSVLYLAHEGRNIMCQRFDSMTQAMEEKRDLRKYFAIARQIVRDHYEEWFSHKDVKPEAHNDRRERMGL